MTVARHSLVVAIADHLERQPKLLKAMKGI
jgi:hypothetical protein